MAYNPLYSQAANILRKRYEMPENGFRQLAMLVAADTPKVAALSLLSRCQWSVESERKDCLLMLEICALEIERRQKGEEP